MKINGVNIGLNSNPFIIAEMSGNHNQSLERALTIVKAAADSGVHALKLQTYTADTITLDVKDGDFHIDDVDNLWQGNNLHDLYELAHTPWDWHKPIMDLANKLGMVCFSSPFDETAVDFLEDLEVPAYKIASFENNHLPLIKKAASTGKPLIISTGMASISEIFEAVETARESGCKDLALLKCTSTYPASPENSNVLTIPHMRKTFNCEVGLSDHSMGIGVSVAAIAHKATIIEKHFTLSRKDGGVDSSFSLEPKELGQLVIETKRAWQSLGKISYGPNEIEKKSSLFRRSIYVSKDVKEGDTFTEHNLRIVRPGKGLHSRYYDKIIGRTALCDIKKGSPMRWDLF